MYVLRNESKINPKLTAIFCGQFFHILLTIREKYGYIK